MEVKVVDTRRENKKDRHGWKADFKINNPSPNTVIYQNVNVKITSSDGDVLEYAFTEAWHYKPTRKITDSFLVPLNWRKNLKGRMRVKAQVWAEEGKMNPTLKKGKGSDYWGNLHGSFNLLTPQAPITKRKVVIKWKNLGKTKASDFSNGKDLFLEENKVIYK